MILNGHGTMSMVRQITKQFSDDFIIHATFIFDLGNCFSFNTNIQNPLTTNHFGPKSGLALELFTGLIGNCLNSFFVT